jgi:membrane associated rhomboid family serine protease/Flp pilus assembly protein TadD
MTTDDAPLIPDERQETHAATPADEDLPQVPAPPVFRPWATYCIIGLNVLVYVLMVASGISPLRPHAIELIRWGADFGPLTLTSEPYRMLSSEFVHIGFVHIALNMIALLLLGSLAEAIYKRTAFLFIYILSGMAGSLASLTAFPLLVSAGASGAVFGIVGALIAAFKVGRLQLPRAVIKRELTVLFAFAIVSLLEGAIRTGMNNAAHLGGLAAGSLMGIIIAVAFRRRNEYRHARNIAFTLMIVIVVGGYFTVRELRAYTVHMFTAIQALSGSKFTEARDQLQAAIRHRPNDAIAYAYLGTAYTRLGDMPGAEAAFRRSVELNPRDLSARFQLAVVYYTEGKLTDAVDTMQQVIQAQPNDPQFHEFLAQIFSQQGNNSQANQEHTRAMELMLEQQQQR